MVRNMAFLLSSLSNLELLFEFTLVLFRSIYSVEQGS